MCHYTHSSLFTATAVAVTLALLAILLHVYIKFHGMRIHVRVSYYFFLAVGIASQQNLFEVFGKKTELCWDKMWRTNKFFKSVSEQKGKDVI